MRVTFPNSRCNKESWTSEATGSVEPAQLPLTVSGDPRTNHSGVDVLTFKIQFNKHSRLSSGLYGIMPSG